MMDTCFKLHGYPVWYNNFKDKEKGKGGPRVTEHAYTHTIEGIHDTPLEDIGSNSANSTGQFDPNQIQALA